MMAGIFLSSLCLAQEPVTQVGLETAATQSEATVAKSVLISAHLRNQSILVANHLLIDKPINGDAFIVAGKADLQSDIAGNVILVAGQATIAGNIQGDVIALGGNIDISSTAIIKGNFNYLKPSSINLAPGATIKGKLEPWVKQSPVIERPYITTPINTRPHQFPIVFYSGLFVVGLILCLGFASYSRTLLDAVWQRPWLALLSGLSVFIVTPMLILTSIVTIIGIPFSIILFGFYLAGLWLAYAYAAWLIGASFIKLVKSSVNFNYKKSRVLALFIGLIALYFLGGIPYIGFWFKGFALLLGLGGIVLTFMLERPKYVSKLI
jgi:cytoskeletal protein CcmA (bactofilin family)